MLRSLTRHPMLVTALALLAASNGARAQNCANTAIGITPLDDLGAGAYLGAQGGLYAGGSNLRPHTHDLAGRAIAAAVTPRNAAGQPDPNGAIVLLSLGMSNTTQEFSRFVTLAQTFANLNPRVRLIDGAQGGQDAVIIADPAAQFWTIVNQRLQSAGLTPAQVQAVWLKEAIAGPASVAPGPFPAHPVALQALLQTIAQNVTAKFPRARQAYLSSRIYAGYATSNLNPEPYAYDSAFAVKWLLQDQIGGAAPLNWSPASGPVLAPWLSWGPYMWADGLTPRSDGLTWSCSDFQADGTHPGPDGRLKVAQRLLAFFSRDITTRPWFVRRGADLNDDGAINFADLNLVLGTYGLTREGGPILGGDANADGVVDFADLNLVLSQFGT